MSASVNAGEAEIVKEGFLCPICLRDLGDVIQLQAHFAERHSSNSGDLALHQLKDLFGRAKQRILKFESSLYTGQTKLDVETVQTDWPASVAFTESPQIEGPTTSHTVFFKRLRDTHIDQFAVETNRLIIRLDKLISETPSDPTKRKGIQETFERETVPWADDSDAQFCRHCGGKFSLTKRRHHCRLCGRIICGGCSQFLTFTYARKLTNPAFAAGYQAEAEKSSEKDGKSRSPGGRRLSGTSGGSPNMQIKAAGEKLLSTLATKLKRDASEVSISSLFNQEGEEQLRICKDCKHLLDKRDQQIEQRTQPPIIVQMYERLRASMEDCERLYPSYLKMAESLNAGESLYDLETAKDARMRLLKIQEQIDYISKKIAVLGLDNSPDTGEGEGPSLRHQLLQKYIRQFAAAFVQDIAYNTPNLPSPAELEQLQKQHRLELQREIERERSVAAASAAGTQGQKAVASHARQPSPDARYKQKLIGHPAQTDAGWTPDTSTVLPSLFRFNPLDNDQPIDPLKEQILLIKGYLKQAVLAGRLDEAQLLERNLHELEEALKLQSGSSTPREV